MRDFWGGLIGILAAALVIFLVLQVVVGNYAVISDSMEPGVQSGEQVLINKLAYKIQDPQRGDIVCYASPADHSTQLKRVIGLPGDILEVESGVLFLNGHQITEPYARQKSAYTLSQYQVPLDHYFVLNDNRSPDADDPVGCTVPAGNIQGKAWLQTWPPEEWGAVAHYNLTSQLATAELPD